MVKIKIIKIFAFKSTKLFQISKGQVDLYWNAVVKADSKLQIKVCSKLTQDHVQPHFKIINVRMAFQVFILRWYIFQ